MPQTDFPINSRYHGIESTEYTSPDGRTIVYLSRRFVPASNRLQQMDQHTVQDGDRLDNIADKYFGDPELFWRICDGNDAQRPEELTNSPGRQLRITLPEGVEGPLL